MDTRTTTGDLRPRPFGFSDRVLPAICPHSDAKKCWLRLCKPGWCLVTGEWLAGWAAIDDVHEVEIRADGKVFHRAELNRPRPELATALRLPNTNAAIGFYDQVDLSAIGDYTGTVKMTTPGTEESRAKARKLIDAIRQRSEPVNVDLGCGFRKKGNVGIDVTPHGTEADIICRIGFEPIPLDDEVADTVYCRDFLEHIPKAYYSEHDRILRYPVIEVMNEVWRILKPGGTFTSFTPCYPAVEVHRDPTHLSVWTLESMQYFCGKYPIARIYGVRTNFEILVNRLDGFYLHAVRDKDHGPRRQRAMGKGRTGPRTTNKGVGNGEKLKRGQ